MLSDHEQRALAELELSFAMEAVEPVRSGPQPVRGGGRSGRRWPGCPVVLVLGAVSVALLVAGAAAAGFALATATAIGWLFWRLCSGRAAGEGISVAVLIGAGHGRSGSGRRAGAAILQYLRRLPEAE